MGDESDELRMLKDELRRMNELLIRMDERMSSLSDHEIRIRSLEKSRWPLPSLAILISAGAVGINAVLSLLGS